MNNRRNPTLRADNRFFSPFFAVFSRRDDIVAQRLWGRLALNRLITSNRPGQKRGQFLISSIKGEAKKKHLSLRRKFSRFAAHVMERDLF